MAFRALLEADLASMARSWVVRIWLGLMAAQALVTVPAAIQGGDPASDALAGLLGTYPVIWSTFAIIVSGGAVASEAGVVADSILSKAVTRYDYILAKFASRLITVLGLYLLVTLPATYLMSRAAGHDLTARGVIWAIVLVGLMLVLLTNLAVSCSTLFNRTLVAVVVVWVLWYAAGGIFALLELAHLSPLHVVESLPDMLRGDTNDTWRTLAGFALPSGALTLLAVAYFARKDV
jgi:ABC-2 type transport system permease protein